jgi:hypothetical protein
MMDALGPPTKLHILGILGLLLHYETAVLTAPDPLASYRLPGQIIPLPTGTLICSQLDQAEGWIHSDHSQASHIRILHRIGRVRQSETAISTTLDPLVS